MNKRNIKQCLDLLRKSLLDYQAFTKKGIFVSQVFNLMSEINKTTFLVQHKSSDCKWGLNESVCKSKKKWMNGSVSVKS